MVAVLKQKNFTKKFHREFHGYAKPGSGCFSACSSRFPLPCSSRPLPSFACVLRCNGARQLACHMRHAHAHAHSRACSAGWRRCVATCGDMRCNMRGNAVQQLAGHVACTCACRVCGHARAPFVDTRGRVSACPFAKSMLLATCGDLLRYGDLWRNTTVW